MADDKIEVKIIADASDLDAKTRKAADRLASFQQSAKEKSRVYLTARLNDLEKNLKIAKKRLEEYRKAGNKSAEIKAKLEVGRLQRDISTAKKGLRDLDKTAQTTGKSFFSLTRLTKDFLKVIGGLAILRTLMRVFNFAVDAITGFETAMSNINTLLGDNKNQFETLKNGVKEFARTSVKPVSELTEALYDVVSAGIDADDQLNVLRQSEKLAVAGLGSVKEATDLVTSSVNAFGVEAERAAQVAFGAVAAGKTTVSELSQGFGLVAGTAKEAGVSFEELFAITATGTTTGQKASQVWTQQRAILTNLTKPTREMSDLYEKLNVQSGKELIASSGGLYNALEKLSEASEGNSETFAKALGSAEGLALANQLLGSSSKKLGKILNDLNSDTDVLSQAYEKQTKTVSALWQNIVNNLEVAMLDFGEKVLPSVADSLDHTSQSTGSLSSFLQGLGATVVLLYETFMGAMDGIATAVGSAYSVIYGASQNITGLMAAVFNGFVDGVETAINAVVESINRSITDIVNAMDVWGINGKMRTQQFVGRVQLEGIKFDSPDLTDFEAGIGAAEQMWQEFGDRGLERQKRIINAFDFSTKATAEGAKAYKEQQEEVENLNKELGKLNENLDENASSAGGSSSAAEKNDEQIKKNIKSIEDFKEANKEAAEEYVKSLDEVSDKLEELEKDYVEFYDEIIDKIDEAKDAQSELTDEIGQSLGERAVDLGVDVEGLDEKIAEIRKELEGLNVGSAESDSDREKILEKREELQEDLNKLLEERKTLQEELAQIEEYASENADVRASIEEEARKAKLTETERLIEEYEKEYNAQQRIIDLNQRFLDLVQGEGSEAREKLFKIANSELTATKEEIDALLKELGFGDLTDEETEALLGKAQTQRELDVEKEKVEAQQEELLAVRKEFFDKTRSAFSSSVDDMIAKEKELIDQIKRAQEEQRKLNALRGAGGSSGGSTQNNTFNYNVNNEVDLDSAVNRTTRSITP